MKDYDRMNRHYLCFRRLFGRRMAYKLTVFFEKVVTV